MNTSRSEGDVDALSAASTVGHVESDSVYTPEQHIIAGLQAKIRAVREVCDDVIKSSDDKIRLIKKMTAEEEI